MLEILILSILGFAGAGIGGMVSSDDDGNVAADEADASSDTADDLSGDLLLGTLETDIPVVTVEDDQISLDVEADENPEGLENDPNSGVDVQIGTDFDDVLTDWTGSNEMYGGDGDDTLQGGFDVGELSVLHGDAGDDALQIRGATEAYGGEGTDTFIQHLGR
ncbi:MAG: hypothetical protein QNK92_13995 [Amylibacter sp.]